MNPENLVFIFQRDIKALQKELLNYQTESNLWLTTDGISNSAGNLALHLIGNLNHFIGSMLGNTGYVRTREREFADKNIARDLIIAQLDSTSQMLGEVLPQLTAERLAGEFPFRLQDQAWTVEAFLLHLVAHFNYHLGQVNYHRRLLDNHS
jgi:uncharacterized damage-inducible protein DinB